MSNARSAKSAREKAAEMRAGVERAAARKRVIVAGIAVFVVILLAVGATVFVRSLQDRQRDREAAAAAPPANLYSGVSKVGGGGLLVGKETAKITVDIYEDFLCPICKQVEVADGPVLQKYSDAGQIKVVYHPVAILDRASSGTRYSTRAANAMAVVLNTNPEVTQAFHNALFANQPEEGSRGLADNVLIEFAKQAGVTQPSLEKDITGLRFEKWVTSTTEQFSKEFAPAGTPTIVINGQKIKDISPTGVTTAIEAELKKK